MIKTAMRLYPDLIALLCGLLVIPWIVGVPGQASQIAIYGWTTGLITMALYLVIYQAVKSVIRMDFYKKNNVLHKPVTRLLNSAAVCVLPVLVFSLLLIIRV